MLYLMKNYLSAFSRWIANLGVVPLLLFAAFLLFPDFAFLLSLLFFVTLVLETISQLLYAQINRWCNYSRPVWHVLKFNNRKKLQTFRFIVKAPLYLSLLFAVSHQTLSREPQLFQRVIDDKLKRLHLTKGEVIQLSLKGFQKYTIGNKEILTAKKIKAENSLLLKGASLGQTDLYLWKKGEEFPQRVEIIVFNKRHKLPLKRIAAEIEKQGLEIELIGERVRPKGKLNSEEQYTSLLELNQAYPKSINLERLDLSPELKREKFKKLLLRLSDYNLHSIDCRPEKILFRCLVSQEVQKKLSPLRKEFFIEFPTEGIFTLGKQYRVTLTLHQFENSKGQAFEFGLQKVEGSLNNLLLNDPLALIKENQISLKENRFKSQTLARPILKGKLNTPMKVRIGQEINFLQSVSNGVATQSWRFAGLGIDLSLLPHSDQLHVKFKTNLSQPSENGIAINSQQSELLVELNKEHILFDIGFNVNHNRKTAIPYLSQIPIFGSLFQGKASEKSFKKILCVIKVEEI